MHKRIVVSFGKSIFPYERWTIGNIIIVKSVGPGDCKYVKDEL